MVYVEKEIRRDQDFALNDAQPRGDSEIQFRAGKYSGITILFAAL